jgi:hypothetical protein
MIQDSFDGNHRKAAQIKMKMANGELAETDDQNADVLQPHFDKIFNGQHDPVDIPAVIDQIPLRTTMHELLDGSTIHLEELENQIQRAKNANRSLLATLRHGIQDNPTQIQADNRGAMCNKWQQHNTRRTRHIVIKQFVILQCGLRGRPNILHRAIAHQLSY